MNQSDANALNHSFLRPNERASENYIRRIVKTAQQQNDKKVKKTKEFQNINENTRVLIIKSKYSGIPFHSLQEKSSQHDHKLSS
jgi:hypothetical protein